MNLAKAQDRLWSFNGHVMDENNKPATGAQILILGRTEKAFSDDNGNFTLSLVDSVENFMLVAQLRGYEPRHEYVRLSQKNTTIQISPQAKQLAAVPIDPYKKSTLQPNAPLEDLPEEYDINVPNFNMVIQRFLEQMVNRKIHDEIKRICIAMVDANELTRKEQQFLKIHLLLPFQKVLTESKYFSFVDREKIARTIETDKMDEITFMYDEADLQKIIKREGVAGFIYLTILHANDYTELFIRLKTKDHDIVIGQKCLVKYPSIVGLK